jgi:Zn-dependent protease/predicted transcriptional regulator
MRGSIRIGKIAGIPIGLHWSFFLLFIFIIARSTVGGKVDSTLVMMNVLLTVGVFVCVLFHELGHSFAANRFGIRTRNILLLPFGGAANLERMPEIPRQELMVFLAGPLVNLLIAVAIFCGLMLNARETFGGGTTFSIEQAQNILTLSEPATSLWEQMFLVNIFLAVFNLLPALPLDGGRALRALLSYKMSRGRATEFAARLGQAFAIAFIGLAFYFTDWMLMIVAVFILMGAENELQFARAKSILSKYTVKEAMITELKSFSIWDTVNEAFEGMKCNGCRKAIVKNEDKIAGIVHQKMILAAMAAGKEDELLCKIMIKDFVSVEPSLSLEKAIAKMEEARSPVLGVTDDSGLVGLISWEKIKDFIKVQEMLNSGKKTSPTGNEIVPYP